MTLKIEPLSSTSVAALNSSPVTQKISIAGGGGEFKLRFKTAYSVNGARVDESGEFQS
jgi:hypothetical protein